MVELLAVIVILAIVVGISIPTILGVINGAKKKALQTAADAAANWFDKQYDLYRLGTDSLGNSDINEQFKTVCFTREKHGDTNFGENGGYHCDDFPNLLTNELTEAAGLQPEKFIISTNAPKTVGIIALTKWRNDYYSRVYIDPSNGKSCITLLTIEDSSKTDYPTKAIVCGGTCQSANKNKYNYCKSINLN